MKRSAALFSRLPSESHHRVFRELENRSHPPSFCRKQPTPLRLAFLATSLVKHLIYIMLFLGQRLYQGDRVARAAFPCHIYKALLAMTICSQQPTVSCLQGVIHYDNLPGTVDRVLFTRRYSLRQPSRSNRSCLVYKALFTTTAFPEQSTVSCLQGVIHHNLLGAA